MPFDALPEHVADDVARLKVVRDGVANPETWCRGQLGETGGGPRCLLGHLLVACGQDTANATRIAVQYLWPALPEISRKHRLIMPALYSFNDRRSQDDVVALVDRAIAQAEKERASTHANA